MVMIPHTEILRRYRHALLEHFSDQLQRLILFGSLARGEAVAGSDIDILVVVDWEEELLPEGRYAVPFKDPRWRRMVELAYDLSLEYGIILSPLVVSEKRFARWTPLNSRIRREGIELWRKNKKLSEVG